MPPFQFWFTGAALGSFLALIATMSSLTYAWYSAAANEHSKANSSAIAERDKARLHTIREKLKEFYIIGGEILNRPLLKTTTETELDSYEATASAWLNETNNWVRINLGAGASARLLDTAGGMPLSYDRAVNPRHNAMIIALIRYRENLSKMIELNAWDSGVLK